jgi:hypothetical protein
MSLLVVLAPNAVLSRSESAGAPGYWSWVRQAPDPRIGQAWRVEPTTNSERDKSTPHHRNTLNEGAFLFPGQGPLRGTIANFSKSISQRLRRAYNRRNPKSPFENL